MPTLPKKEPLPSAFPAPTKGQPSVTTSDLAPIPAAPPPSTLPGADAGFGGVGVPTPALPAPQINPSVVPLPGSVQPGTFAITPFRTAAFAPGRLLGSGRSVSMENVFGPGTRRAAARPFEDEVTTVLRSLFGGAR